MAFFIPSYIQKRLLRYALSRLELLDTDALDLERLDIGWGRRSTIELRDVGLQKQKLYSLLQIPSYLKVERTNIKSLRLTVPADIHTSSIVVEISGVEVEVALVDNAPPNEKHSRKRPRPGSPAVKKETGHTRHTPHDRLRDWKGGKYKHEGQQTTTGDQKEVIPTPHDLAKSFLEQEPKQERAQLEAELASKSVDLNSTTSSETTEDDSTEGTGVGFALPSFLAAFLTDVVNRLQVQIRDISIKSNLEIDSPFDTKSEHAEKASTSSVTFQVRVAKAEIDGLTTNTSTSPRDMESGVPDEQSKCRSESRCVSLGKIDTFLILDCDLLHTFSQTSYKDELSKGEASAVHSWSNSTEQLVEHTSPRSQQALDPYTRAMPSSLGGASISDQEGESEPASPLQESLMFTDCGNLADAEDDDESVGDATFSHEDFRRPSKYLSRARYEPAGMRSGTDSMVFSRHKHDALSSFRQERSPFTQPQTSYQRPQRVDSPRIQKSIRRNSRFSKTPEDYQTAPFGGLGSASPDESAKNSELIGTENSVENGQGEEVAHSKVLSQQEEDSVYMSFVEDQPDQSLPRPSIPGAWNSEAFHDESTRKYPPDTLDKTARDESHDLLGSKDDGMSAVFSSHEAQIPGGDGGRQHPDQDQDEQAKARKLAIIPLLSIDHLRLWFPCERSPNPDNQSPVQESSSASRAEMSSPTSGKFDFSAPGAFSLYAESVAAERQKARPRAETASSNNHGRVAEKERDAQSSTTFAKVDIGPTTLQLHPTSLKIYHRTFRKCQDIVDFHSNRDQNTNLSVATRSRSLNVSVASIKVSFGEDTCLLASIDGFKGLQKLDPSEKVKSLFDFNVGDLTLYCNEDASKFDLHATVQHLSIEFASRRLLRFDREAQMKASVRDRDLGSNVLSVSFRKHATATETNISSSAVVMDLDFVGLDQTLVSFGGFSGLLDLGSSILSETGSNNATNNPPRHKAVHFDETQGRIGRTDSPRRRQKINLRVGGSNVTMKGETCRVDFRSSAVKVVGRDSAFAVQIDDSMLVGPTLLATTLDKAVQIQLVNLSLRFLSVAEETDLSKLISLLSPSKDKFEEEDDYLVETLISQRRKGSVMRVSIANVDCAIPSIEKIRQLSDFANEITKLSTVTKYLPQETRPGVLMIATVGQLDVNIDGSLRYDRASLRSNQIEIAHVSAPSLVAVGIGRFSLHEATLEKILHQVTPSQDNNRRMLMARFIGEEMEPTVKVKLWNVCLEYSVPLIIKAMGLNEVPCTEDFTIDLAASVANFADHVNAPKESESQTSAKPLDNSQPLKLKTSLRDCGVGLQPRDMTSKALLVLSSCSLSGSFSQGKDLDLQFDVDKASLLLIDDTGRLKPFEDVAPSGKPGVRFADKQQMERLTRHGYVSVCWVSAASAIVKSHRNCDNESSTLDIELRDELFVLETCADSTQTLIQLMGALQPPQPPSTGTKYRTEVEPIQDMMASFTGDAYAMAPKSSTGNVNESAIDSDSDMEEDLDDLRDIVGMMNESEVEENNPFASPPLSSGPEKMEIPLNEDSNSLDMNESQVITGALQPTKLKPREQGMGSKWNSNNNRYVGVTKSEILRCPFRLKIKDMNLIWNLHDGYDWQGTRDTISKAVGEVEAKAEQKRSRTKISRDTSDDDESVIGDFLFNSIYIGVPVNHDPRDLARQINRDVDENVSESTSQPTTVTARPVGTHLARPSKRLKLGRSKRHKITIELRGLSSNVVVYPSGGETLSSTDVRVKDIEVFDHVPTSTWKKFATYWHESAPREDKKPMAHVEVCDVRPVPELTASELVIRVTILPLRLHVDQDALDFMTRFFDFHDETEKFSPPTEQPYLQRVEVRPVSLRLDYKPKKIDYAGLRSGRATEFMNFFILDSADILLRHTIIYGSSNFARLHKSLEDVWMPDIRRNQLPSVLSGLNGVRTAVNVGQGVRDLVEIPIREYKKDGRIVRSISKGAAAFAKTTGSELTKFGAKLAVGAQGYLQGAEEYLSGNSTSSKANQRRDSSRRTSGARAAPGADTEWDDADLDDDTDDEPKRAISRYADQPAGILQGLRGAARNLERDLLLTRDVIVAVSGEVKESGSAANAAKAVGRAAPTVVLRPLVGVSGAAGKVLLGAANTVDEDNYRRVGDKYKRR